MRRKKSSPLAAIIVIMLAGGIVVAAYLYINRGGKPQEAKGNDDNTARKDEDKTPEDSAEKPEKKVGLIDPKTDHQALLPTKAEPSDDIERDYRDGLALVKLSKPTAEQTIEARTLLSRAYFSGKLSKAQADATRKHLTELSEATILSPVVVEGDPYTEYYVFAKGDTLGKVEKDHALKIPHQLLLRVNPHIKQSNLIQIGGRVKLVKGPFHAVIYKDKFVMDIYIKRYETPITFVKRIRVGLGKDDSTPSGAFQVSLGKKRAHAPWNAPPASKVRGTILWGQPGYPLGPNGRWISLQGVDEETKFALGYGIHGTNDPDSIGKAESLGCIRLGDNDIDLVYSLLYEKWSAVFIEK
ncbi:MAG TPA: hypothetical protein ENL03_01650 [Phycisphaerae bacterium]|nr:hypothetical protein [Phycisphaerae bacterium]